MGVARRGILKGQGPLPASVIVGDNFSHDFERLERPQESAKHDEQDLDGDERAAKLTSRAWVEYGAGTFGDGSMIMRSATGEPVGLDPTAAFNEAIRGAGSTVPYKAEMESAFGDDFSDVRAHTGRGDDRRLRGLRRSPAGSGGEGNPTSASGV